MHSLWQDLLALHALIGLFVILWSLAETYLPGLALDKSRVGPGIALGLVAVMTMLMAVEVQPGIRFDLRHALIATSGLLFGPLSALITGAITAALRIYQGGGGMLAGIIGIAVSAGIGSAASLVLKGRLPSNVQCIKVAMVVSLGVVVSAMAIPAEARAVMFPQMWLPLITLTFTSSLFAAFFLSAECARRQEFRTLALYREMVDALPDCLNAKDLDGRFLIANKATAQLMKAGDPADLIGKTDFDFYPSAIAESYRADERAALQQQTPQRLEQMVDFEDGKIGWLETLKVPFRNKEGSVTAVISYNRDITHLHDLNQMKEQFVSMISHEIRTPLTSICGSLRLLNHGSFGAFPPKAIELIDLASRNAHHLNELINNVLDLEKFNQGEMDFAPETIDMAHFADEVVGSMKHFLPNKALTWTISNCAAGAFVRAHPARLRQVLLNLLSNAAKFAPAHSIVEVEITRVDSALRLCVLDSGPGVHPEFEAVLFSRFKQEKATADLNPKNGTGLGLSLIKSFVEHMSGNVSYHRRDDRTEFRVDLPVLPDIGIGTAPMSDITPKAGAPMQDLRRIVGV